MKYSAVAIGVENHGHAITQYSQDFTVILRWAKAVSAARNCNVEIYESTERLFVTIHPGGEK